MTYTVFGGTFNLAQSIQLFYRVVAATGKNSDEAAEPDFFS